MRLQPYLLSVLVALLLIITSCASTGQSANAQLSDAQFETKVLEIIRKNPQVILDSVQSYQRSQAQQEEQLRDKVLSQILQLQVRQVKKLLWRSSQILNVLSVQEGMLW
jgi:type IV pilus biogenesis protein CpaD/CtpE